MTDRFHLHRPRVVPTVLLAAFLLAGGAGLVGCDKVSKAFSRSTIPSIGQPLPYSANVEFDPSLAKSRLQFTNACNSPQELPVGEDLESTLLQAAAQTFKTVYHSGNKPGSAKPDYDIKFGLQNSGLQIQTDGIYDRLPAELTIEMVALYRDSTGKVLAEQPFSITRKEKLILEPTQHRCHYVNTDSIMHDSSVTLAMQFARYTRGMLDPNNAYAMPGAGPQGQDAPAPMPAPVPPIPSPVASSPAAPTGVSFKATVLDESGNQALERGERMKVRVDLVNAGHSATRHLSATLSGTPELIGQFPATTLPVGSLQPGESRSLEFVATVPAGLTASAASLTVSVTDGVAAAAPAQTLSIATKAGAAGFAGAAAAANLFDNVDEVPAAAAGFQRPATYVIAIGISSYRDPLVPGRKFAAQDAELLADYFRAAGGVPAANIRVLQDRKALRPDIEEAILDWVAPRAKADSTVILYFAGQTAVAADGEPFLMPYEGGKSGTARLYPLKDLQAALSKLKVRQSLLIVDAGVLRLGKDAKGKPAPPRWDGDDASVIRLIGAPGLQSGLEPDELKHGLYTYYLLRGLKGEADADKNAEVTLGELAGFLKKSVPGAAKDQFRQEQRPAVFPPFSATSPAASLPLSKPGRMP